MKFLIVLTMLAISALASAQSSVTPSAASGSASAAMEDSAGTMNTEAEDVKNKHIDSTKTEQQRMEDASKRGLDSAEGSMDHTDMNTVPSQTHPSTTPMTP